ncbi:MAG: hypothetical protein WCA35_07020 [Kovacikia sp.]
MPIAANAGFYSFKIENFRLWILKALTDRSFRQLSGLDAIASAIENLIESAIETDIQKPWRPWELSSWAQLNKR